MATSVQLTTPRALNARTVLAAPALGVAGLGLLLMIYQRLGSRLGLDARWTLAKEGALEHLTFIAELLGAALLLIAVKRLWPSSQALDRQRAWVYALGAAMLFVVGMEEVGWGQQLFHFSTPESWAAINHQQETTLHNLLDRQFLTRSASGAAFTFALIALLASTRLFRNLHPLAAALAPHWSLAPLALVIGLAGWKAHPEIIEILMASYACLYAYHAFLRSRECAQDSAPMPSQPNALRAEPATKLTGAPIRILVTGASGFIGSRLALYARQQNYDVIATGLARTPAERARIDELVTSGVCVHDCDLRDATALAGLLTGCDVVVHLAAAQHEANVPDAYFFDVNVNATRSLLNACVEAGIKRFVYASTIGVYGEAGEHALTEESPIDPRNAYGRSKAAAEQVVHEFSKSIPGVIIRISETYGPSDHRLLKLFKSVAAGMFMMIGRGDNRRQPIHVRDLCRGLLLAAEHPDAANQTFVLAGPQVLTTTEMVRAIGAAVGADAATWRLPLRLFVLLAYPIESVCKALRVQPPLHRRQLDFFAKSFWFDTSKAERVLGFAPEIPFLQGAQETARWYRAQGLLKLGRATPDAASFPSVDVPLARNPHRTWQYSEILEFTHDAIIIWEMDGRGIVYWNRAAEQLYGHSRNEALGCVTHTLLQTHVKGGVEHLESQLSRLGVWSGELLHTARDGRRILVQARLALMGQQNGRWLVLEVNRDLSPATIQGTADSNSAFEAAAAP